MFSCETFTVLGILVMGILASPKRYPESIQIIIRVGLLVVEHFVLIFLVIPVLYYYHEAALQLTIRKMGLCRAHGKMSGRGIL